MGAGCIETDKLAVVQVNQNAGITIGRNGEVHGAIGRDCALLRNDCG